MSYEDALKLLEEGRKVKREAWSFIQYIHLVDGVIREDDGFEYSINDAQELAVNSKANDWVEVLRLK